MEGGLFVIRRCSRCIVVIAVQDRDRRAAAERVHRRAARAAIRVRSTPASTSWCRSSTSSATSTR